MLNAASDLSKLVNPSAKIFDPEDMTRELLFTRLKIFLEKRYVDTLALPEIQALTRDLSGGSRAVIPHERAPMNVRRLSCIDYAALSPVNREEAIKTLMNHVGLSHRDGPELLGVFKWAEIQAIVAAKVAGLLTTAEPILQVSYGLGLNAGAEAHSQEATPVATEWSQQAVARRVMAVLDEKRFISLYDVEQIRRAVNELRLVQGMAVMGKSPRDAGLQALSDVTLLEMDQDSYDSLPAAILDALALNNISGPLLFGPVIWVEVRGRFTLGMTARSRGVAESDLNFGENLSFWGWVGTLFRSYKR